MSACISLLFAYTHLYQFLLHFSLVTQFFQVNQVITQGIILHKALSFVFAVVIMLQFLFFAAIASKSYERKRQDYACKNLRFQGHENERVHNVFCAMPLNCCLVICVRGLNIG